MKMKHIINVKEFKNKHLELKRHVNLTYELMYSDAYRTLTASSIHILHRFMQKRTWTDRRGRKKDWDYNDYKNGGLRFPYSEAKIMGIPGSTFDRSLEQLCNLGFITVEHQGGTLGDKQDYTQFMYIENWKEYGKPGFEPGVRPKTIRYSSGFDEFNKTRNEKKQKMPVNNDCG